MLKKEHDGHGHCGDSDKSCQQMLPSISGYLTLNTLHLTCSESLKRAREYGVILLALRKKFTITSFLDF